MVCVYTHMHMCTESLHKGFFGRISLEKTIYHLPIGTDLERGLGARPDIYEDLKVPCNNGFKSLNQMILEIFLEIQEMKKMGRDEM